MPATVVVGAQWGDEGKGKIVDAAAKDADLVVRFQGGANAGHTLVVGDKKTVLHLIPSGILHPDKTCVIGPAVVVDIEKIVQEISNLENAGILTQSQQLKISSNCSVLWPFHKTLDAAREQALGPAKRGTTGRGIGPAYEDRASRTALTLSDLKNPQVTKTKLKSCLYEKNILLKEYGEDIFTVEAMLDFVRPLFSQIEKYVVDDTAALISTHLEKKKQVLFEGAQGSLLDVYHGTYPFVTSSSTLAGSSCTGSGVGPTSIDRVIGITKAYCTRVGTGPFPTELFDKDGEHMAQQGAEFGSTTGRARRCGWLDLVALNYSKRLNSLSSLALMKLDVLTGLETLKICTGYEINGQRVTSYSPATGQLEQARPIYESFSGWQDPLESCRAFEDLPKSARDYVEFISDFVQLPLDLISVGPERGQTLWLNKNII